MGVPMKRMSVLMPLVLFLLTGLGTAAYARPDSAPDPFAPSSAPIPPGTDPDPLGTSPHPLGTTTSSPGAQGMTWSGEGTAIVDAGGPVTESLLFTFQADGVPGDLSVRAVQPGGGAGEQLVSAVGGSGYTTTTVVNRQHGAAFAGFSVVAPGSWTIALRPLDQARQWSTDAPTTGRNGDVLRLGAGLTTLGTLVYDARGTGGFAVYAYTKTGTQTQVVQHTAPVQGAKTVPGGTVLLLVEATGPWTLIRG